ncbi:TonB-dependent receptor [Babesia caballi]|uniref:TonB-dependent receptor n=1 Tax=Babesia caballi TaxID=5871 RepID=A0AAV4LRC8_BABCB|nr:TonB-dependent receptor [Babesia caballi]
MSRQKGAHKCAKAAEVEAVGATGQSSGARVAEEGRGDGAGGADVNVRGNATEAILFHELFKVTATKVFGLPLRFAVVVERGESLEDFFNGGEENPGASNLFVSRILRASCAYVGVPRTCIGRGVGTRSAIMLYLTGLHNTVTVNFDFVTPSSILIPDELRESIAHCTDQRFNIDILAIDI